MSALDAGAVDQDTDLMPIGEDLGHQFGNIVG